ncbi:MAG: M16 family metallopeptidase [Anaerolineales bacterium]
MSQLPITHYASLPGPDDITETTLPNGIVVLARANFSSPSVVVNGYLRAGSIYEPDEKLGLGSFTAAALMRGTALRSHIQLYDALESAGASLGFNTTIHTIGFGGKALAEDLDLLLDLTAESLRAPVFPLEEIERLRAQILTGLALQEQNTESMAALTFDKLVYAGHPYSRPGNGRPETVQSITRDDMLAFHRKHYGPGGMVITVVGGVEPARSVEKVAQIFGNWENPGQPEITPLPDLAPLNGSPRQHVFIPGKSQTNIILGTGGPSTKTPGFLAASLGNNALGQFGMYGRIGEVVREQSGLAYYAYSSLSGGVGPGPWYFTAGVDPANVEQAIDLIRQEIARFVDEGITEDELADSKANYIGSLPLSLESNAGVAGALLNLKRYDFPLDYYQAYPDRINAVTTEEVLEVTRQYLRPDRLAVATAGPESLIQ